MAKKKVILAWLIFGGLLSSEVYSEHIFDTHGLKCTGGMFLYGELPAPESIQTEYIKFTRVDSEVPDPNIPFHLKFYEHPPTSDGFYEWSDDYTIRAYKMEYLIEHISWGSSLSMGFWRLNRETLIFYQKYGAWYKEDQCELISNEKMDKTIALIAQEQEKELDERLKI